jgi:hypothetical protein
MSVVTVGLNFVDERSLPATAVVDGELRGLTNRQHIHAVNLNTMDI